MSNQPTTATTEAVMQNPTTRPKTTCGEHRRVGYYFLAGLLTCRGCHLGADLHETTDETLDRKRRDQAVYLTRGEVTRVHQLTEHLALKEPWNVTR